MPEAIFILPGAKAPGAVSLSVASPCAPVAYIVGPGSISAVPPDEAPAPPALAALLRGPAGPISNFTGFGWIDYSDVQNGVALALPADTVVQINRPLLAAPVNSQLAAPWDTWNFFGGTDSDRRFMPRALEDVYYVSIATRIIASQVGGSVHFGLDVGGTAGLIVESTEMLSAPVGEENRLRFDFIVPVRSSFFANGGRMMLTSSVPASLYEFSPEVYPQSHAA